MGLLLLLACTNLAGFLLARALDPRREVALRLALGASRGALVRQLLTESTMLGLLGGGVGLGLANADLPLPFTLTLDLRLDANVLAFTLGISVLAGTLLGLVPALQSTRPDVAATLKAETAGGGQPGAMRWRNALVVTQLTVSLMLLVGAALALCSFQQVQGVDPGFERDPTAILTVRVPPGFTVEQSRQYTRRLLDRFLGLPGVDAVGLIDFMPLYIGAHPVLAFNVDGHEPPREQDAFQGSLAVVDGGFFDAAGIRIVRGRRFTDVELPDGQRVAILSEAMARRFWPDGDAVGRLVRRPGADDADLRVVGVAADIKLDSQSEAPRLMVYVPYAQVDTPLFSIVTRTSADPDQTAVALLTAGRELDSELMVFEAKTMVRHLALMLLPYQLGALLLSVFGVLALLLAAIGLYGVVSYAVATRTREVGIRMALGADAPAVVRLLTTSGARLVAIGGAIGLALSLLVSSLLSRLLFGVETFDPITYVAAPFVLGATALLAAYLPARRAIRVDSVAALRAD